jgi:hypothetical protein
MGFLKSRRGVRTIAGGAAALAVGVAAFHVYWAVGGMWALDTISGGEVETTSEGARIFYAVVAVLAWAAAIDVLALGGVLRSHHLTLLRKSVWGMTAILGVGGMMRLGVAPIVGTTAIVLAVLFGLVALAAESAEHART